MKDEDYMKDEDDEVSRKIKEKYVRENITVFEYYMQGLAEKPVDYDSRTTPITFNFFGDVENEDYSDLLKIGILYLVNLNKQEKQMTKDTKEWGTKVFVISCKISDCQTSKEVFVNMSEESAISYYCGNDREAKDRLKYYKDEKMSFATLTKDQMDILRKFIDIFERGEDGFISKITIDPLIEIEIDN